MKPVKHSLRHLTGYFISIMHVMVPTRVLRNVNALGLLICSFAIVNIYKPQSLSSPKIDLSNVRRTLRFKTWTQTPCQSTDGLAMISFDYLGAQKHSSVLFEDGISSRIIRYLSESLDARLTWYNTRNRRRQSGFLNEWLS